MRQLWPAGGAEPLTDGELRAAYAHEPRDEPWLRVNFVTSADGAVTVEEHSAGLSSGADKRVFGLLRTLCDVLLVGAGTLRQESYGPVRLDQRRRDWRRAAGLAETPTLALVSSRLDLDPSHPALADAPVRPIVFTHGGSPLDRRDALSAVADVIVVGGAEVDLVAARKALVERGMTQILSEGGPHLFGSLLAADAVDELCLTVAPLLAGPGAGRIVAGPGAARLEGTPSAAPGAVSPESGPGAEAATGVPRHLRLAHVLEAEGNLLVRYTRR